MVLRHIQPTTRLPLEPYNRTCIAFRTRHYADIRVVSVQPSNAAIRRCARCGAVLTGREMRSTGHHSRSNPAEPVDRAATAGSRQSPARPGRTTELVSSTHGHNRPPEGNRMLPQCINTCNSPAAHRRNTKSVFTSYAMSRRTAPKLVTTAAQTQLSNCAMLYRISVVAGLRIVPWRQSSTIHSDISVKGRQPWVFCRVTQVCFRVSIKDSKTVSGFFFFFRISRVLIFKYRDLV